MYCAALAFLLNPSKCRSLVHFSVFVCGWMCVCVCVCVCIHSVAMRHWEDALAIAHITFMYKVSLLSGQNMGDTLPKVAASLLANSKNNATGYFIITIRAVSCDFLSFLGLFAFFST